MSARFLRLALAALVLILVGGACNRPPDNPQDYAARIAVARAEKNEQFQKSSEPIPASKKAEFLPLAYFPIDPEYDVVAALTLSSDDTKLMMPTSSGQPRQVRRLGTLEFTLKGQLIKLESFIEVGAPDINRITVMFSDRTSGKETYEAGRYIDLDRTATGLYDLDFNKAYHPYCVYNSSYECPIPPPENRLKIPVQAGEKLKSSPRTS